MPRSTPTVRPTRKANQPRRLCLERLEDRLAPAVLVQSTFDTGDDGWRVGEFFSSAGDTVPTFLATGGNPGGVIRTTDAGNIVAFQAPAAYLGNQSAAYGGVFHVEERVLTSDGANYPVAAISDGNLFLQFRAPPPGADWTAYDVPFLASAGWEIINPASPTPTGPLASEAQLQQVLSNLTLFHVFADWKTGADRVDLDNVRLESPVPSTFDTGPNGWRIGEFFSSAGDSAPTYLATGGNSGGAIRATDVASVTAFQAPPAFLGNQSAYYGGTLHLEQRLLASNGLNYPMALLSDGTLFLQFRTPPPGTGWTLYDIPLVASAGWEVSDLSDTADADPPASEAQLQQVLGNLTLFNLRVDWRSGADQVDLDNVRLESAPCDLEVTISDFPDPVTAGATLTYTIEVTNHGPEDAVNVTVATEVPALTTFVSFTPVAGGTTTTPAVGGTGAITSTMPLLAAGDSASFLMVVQVTSNGDAAVIDSSASVSSDLGDPNPSNNTAGAATILHGTIRWNTDQSGLWTDAANWDAGFVPRPGDNVIIDRPGVEIVVTMPQGEFFVAGLTSQEKLVIGGGGSLTLKGGAQLSELDIQVDADLIIDTADPVNIAGEWNNAGRIEWIGSGSLAFTQGANLNNVAGGFIQIDTAEPLNTIAGDWNNAGRIAWIGSGSLAFTQGANLNNLAGGIFEIHTAEPAGAEPAGISFQGGRLNNLAGGAIDVNPAEPAGIRVGNLMNAGMVAVEDGTLEVGDGLSTGRFETAAGAKVRFADSFTWNDGTTFAGTGSILNNGFLTVEGNVFLANLVNAGRILVLRTLNIGNGLSAGIVDVGILGTLNFVGHFLTTEGSVFNVQGRLRVDPPEPASGTVTFNERIISPIFEIGQHGAVHASVGLTVLSTLYNAGTLSIHDTTGVGGDINNTGTLSIYRGITTSRGINNSGTLSNGGTVVSGIINNTGTLSSNGGTIVSGVINNTGTLSGNGIIRGNVLNAGIVSPGLAAGILTIQGNYTQTARGSLVLEIGGRRANNHDVLKITGKAKLAGRLQVEFLSGFHPRPRDRFLILRCQSIAGKLTIKPRGLQLSADGFLIKI